MKKLITAVAASAALLFPLTAACEEQTVLPSPGDIISGFEVEDIRPYEAVDAEVVLFRHQKTGAQVMYIANDDTNRAFDLTFWTHATDDTGLPHVFEHATLDGSEKYPSKSLFFNLIYQTYNTYMNAMTFDRMTTYPVASLSEDQLLKYADYYTDSCLHPMILQDESIFREEAWRYRMADEDAPLTIEGTVYSEMLGAETLESRANQNFLSDAFPGSWIRYQQGGNPDVIPEMTYESLRDYHDLFYHPSNCLAFLYGDIQNYEAFLAQLDEAFSSYESKEFEITDEAYQPLEASVENTWFYPVEASSDPSYASTAYYGIIMPGLEDEQELMQLDLLSSILADDSSGLSQSLQSVLPYADFSCYLEMAGPDPVMVFIANYINEGDEVLFRQTIDEALSELASSGISEELAEAVQSSRVLTSRLRREGTEANINLISYLAYNAALYENVWSGMMLEDCEESIEEWSKDGTFASLAGKWLTGDAIRVLSATNPDPGAKEAHDAVLADALQEIKDKMTEEEKAAIIEASNAQGEADDASSYVRSLQAVTVDTLPEELPSYEIQDETDDSGIRHVEASAAVEGVGTAELLLDAGSLSLEDLKWMRLLAELQGYIDSSSHTRQELAVLMQHYFYNGAVSFSILTDENKNPHPYYAISWSSLTEELEEGYDLAFELAFEQALDEEHAGQIRDALQGLLADKKSAITQSPYSTLIYKALGRGDSVMAMSDSIGNVNYYRFLEEAEVLLEEHPEEVLENLIRVREQLCSRKGMIAAYAGDAESFGKNRECADRFSARLSDTEADTREYENNADLDSYALIVDSPVCYNGYAADYDTLGLGEFDAGIDVVTSVITDQFLYPLLRDQYGAYGVFNAAMEDSGIYMVSYRDPNLAETFSVYEQLPDLLRQYQMDQETVDGYILSAYSGVALPSGELSGALEAVMDHLDGKDPARKMKWLEQIKAVTPETVSSFADVYAALAEKGVRISAGGAGMIREHADLFEEIEAPFEQAGETADETETEF